MAVPRWMVFPVAWALTSLPLSAQTYPIGMEGTPEGAAWSPPSPTPEVVSPAALPVPSPFTMGFLATGLVGLAGVSLFRRLQRRVPHEARNDLTVATVATIAGWRKAGGTKLLPTRIPVVPAGAFKVPTEDR